MNKIYLSWSEVFNLLKTVDIPGNKIYGVPKAGMILTGFLKHAENCHDINKANIILDDLIDSGNTCKKYKMKYPDKVFTALISKKRSVYKGKWIVFPWESEHPSKEDSIQENIVRILEYIGENPKREGLAGTPDRVIKMYSEIFRGYNKELYPKVTVFENGKDGLVYDQMILDEGDYDSHCEHHMVPFFGKYHFGYVPHPKGSIIGLSKVARIVDFHSAKLQIQERLVHDIIEDIWQKLKAFENPPLGMGLVMTGEHLCKTMRGVKKRGKMTTIKLKGVFLSDSIVKSEFLSRCII